MKIDRQTYLDKVKGCWLGKTVGGTLGAPMEWHRAFNDVQFYLQDLQGNPVPNDDLDLQIIWLYALEHYGARLTATDLGEFFLKFVSPYWAEYGIAKNNLQAGILPPMSGMVGNAFKNSCGSYIRSEIWACVAPGCPRAAIHYALMDSCVDHGWGEGTYAEAFTAALAAAAFAESDIRKLTDIALSYIPAETAVAAAVRLAGELYAQGVPLEEARERMIRAHYSGFHFAVSEEDEKKGLGGGEVGEEAPTNIGMIALALYYGEGDFEKSLLAAIHCGEDTDCTAGTVGALFGIVLGAKGLPEKWTAPIGENVVTMCIQLGEFPVPQTVGELTDRVARAAREVAAAGICDAEWTEGQTDENVDLVCRDIRPLYRDQDAVFYHLGTFDALIRYPDGMESKGGAPVRVRAEFVNPLNLPVALELRARAVEGARVVGAENKRVALAHNYPFLKDENFSGRVSAEFEFAAEEGAQAVARAQIEIRAQGRAQTFVIPVLFLAGE